MNGIKTQSHHLLCDPEESCVNWDERFKSAPIVCLCVNGSIGNMVALILSVFCVVLRTRFVGSISYFYFFINCGKI